MTAVARSSKGPGVGMGRGVRGFSGAALRKAREDVELNVGDFAAEAEVSETTVHRWEAGRSLPTAYHLQKVAQVLGKSAADLVPHRVEHVRAMREFAGLSIDEAAHRAGVARSTIHRLERAAGGGAEDRTIAALAKAYGRTTDEVTEALHRAVEARKASAQSRTAARHAQ